MFKQNSAIVRYSSWTDWFQIFTYWPENIQFIGIFAAVAYIYKKAGGDFAPSSQQLATTLQNHSQTWLPSLTSLVVHSIGSIFFRYREDREVQRNQTIRFEEKLYTEMQAHMTQGDSALNERQYHLAKEHYEACESIYSQLFKLDARTRAKQLYFSCIYKQALTLFLLRRYDNALKLLIATITEEATYGEMHGYLLLLNLRGLIHYKLSNLPLTQLEEAQSNAKAKKTELAKSDFFASYKIDPTQNYIYLFLRYLSEDGNQFIASNIPNELFSPNIDLSDYSTDIMKDDITDICAKACIQNQNWEYGICLLEDRLASINPNSCYFFELAQLNLQCLQAYNELISTNLSKPKVKLLKIRLEPEYLSNKKIQYIPKMDEENCDFETVIQRRDEKIKNIEILLGSAAFIFLMDAKMDIAECKNRINCGLLYQKLADILKSLNECDKDKSLNVKCINEIELRESALKQFQFVENNISSSDSIEFKDLKILAKSLLQNPQENIQAKQHVKK